MRKRLSTLALAGAAALIAGAATAQEAGPRAGGPGPRFAEAHGPHRGGLDRMRRGAGIERLEQLFEQFDADGDGTLTQAEIDAGRAAQLGEFDADGDGALALAEYQALWLDAMRERMVDRFQYHDDDGDGLVTVEEFSEMTENLVRRLDRTGDDALSIEDAERRGRRGE